MREIRILRRLADMCLNCRWDQGVIGGFLRHDEIKRGLRVCIRR